MSGNLQKPWTSKCDFELNFRILSGERSVPPRSLTCASGKTNTWHWKENSRGFPRIQTLWAEAAVPHYLPLTWSLQKIEVAAFKDGLLNLKCTGEQICKNAGGDLLWRAAVREDQGDVSFGEANRNVTETCRKNTCKDVNAVMLSRAVCRHAELQIII